MTEEEKQRLNERLAIYFLGIKKIYYSEWDTDKHYPMYIPSGKPWRTHQIDAKPIPNFLDPNYGIASCFKWLVPKLDDWKLQKDDDAVIAGAWLDSKYENDRNNNPALALCLAIEKLLPNDVNKEESQ